MKICIVTGARSDWGLLEPLARLMADDPEIDFRLLVTGSHLSPEHGMTVDQIELSCERVECVLAGDTAGSIGRGAGLAVQGFAGAWERSRPDLVVVLGDRWEILAAVMAAHIAGIPVAHIHGGEITEGAYDDAFRHSITHMAQLHFPAAEPYRQRLIQLGQHPDTVFNVGCLGVDGLKKRNGPGNGKVLVMYHPQTLSEIEAQRHEILLMIRMLPIDGIYIGPQADVGSSTIMRQVEASRFSPFGSEGRGQWRPSMPRPEFLHLLAETDAIIGNSSSGIIEAPALGVPTINIGDRQKGRLMASSIIQAEPTEESIKAAFTRLYSPEFQASLEHIEHPYAGDKQGNVAGSMLEIIKRTINDGIEMKKGFYDLQEYGLDIGQRAMGYATYERTFPSGQRLTKDADGIYRYEKLTITTFGH